MLVALFCLIFIVEKCEPPNEPQGQRRLRQAQVAARMARHNKVHLDGYNNVDYDRARIAAEMSPNEFFFELYRRKTLAAARRSLAIVSALVG
jgi:hypothetical protein